MLRPRALATLTLAYALLLAPAARAAGVLPEEATPVQREQAQSRFLRGKELLAKKDFAGALGEFRASQEIVASPNTRLQIARSLLGQGKTVAAYVEFGRTAVEAKELLAQDTRYQRAYDAANAERAELEPRLGFVSMQIENPSDGTTVTVAGEPVQRAAWPEPAPVIEGDTTVVVQTPGHAPVERTVSVKAGQKFSLTVDAQSGAADATQVAGPSSPGQGAHSDGMSPLRLGAYVAGGVGVLGLATFAVFGAMASSTYGDLNGACGGGPCPASKSGEISSGKTDETLANIGLVVGALGVGAGATLFVLSMPKSSPAASAAVVVSPNWAGVRGTW
jgi:hypothetical protein